MSLTALPGAPATGHSNQVATQQRQVAAWQDLVDSLKGWRLWVALGNIDIAHRYRRSRIGQFWITISMAVFIISIGSVYALLFSTELRHQLPHVVVYYTAWSFISQSLNEGASAFTDSERYLRQERLPKLTFVFRVVWRNLLAYIHNLVLLPVVFAVFGVPLKIGSVAALAGVMFLLVNVILVVTVFSVLCTRFRDLRQIVQSMVQIAFFATPIMWRPSILPANAQFIVDFNPVAAMLRLIGEPLLGNPVPMLVYVECAGCTLLLMLIAVPLFIRFRERLIYWL